MCGKIIIMIIMVFLGRADEFKPGSGSWFSYVKPVVLFFDANDISNENRAEKPRAARE